MLSKVIYKKQYKKYHEQLHNLSPKELSSEYIKLKTDLEFQKSISLLIAILSIFIGTIVPLLSEYSPVEKLFYYVLLAVIIMLIAAVNSAFIIAFGTMKLGIIEDLKVRKKKK